jgi:hypothetical protein
MRLRYLALGLVLFGLLTGVGCGKGKTVKVEGVVTLDNQPVEGAMVRFVPVDPAAGQPASGITGSDGHFRLTTRSPNDGAMPGEYKVQITLEEKQEGGPGIDFNRPDQVGKAMKGFGEQAKATSGGQRPATKKTSIPEIYGSDRTTLRAVVPPPESPIRIDLRSTGG